MKPPVFLIIAGPNGAGKTTAAQPLLELMGIREYVNADVIAQGFSMLHAEAMAFTAGRLALRRLHTLIDQQRSFAFETTLASRSITRLICQAQARQFRTQLFFLALPSPELAVDRVARRVEMGGLGHCFGPLPTSREWILLAMRGGRRPDKRRLRIGRAGCANDAYPAYICRLHGAAGTMTKARWADTGFPSTPSCVATAGG